MHAVKTEVSTFAWPITNNASFLSFCHDRFCQSVCLETVFVQSSVCLAGVCYAYIYVTGVDEGRLSIIAAAFCYPEKAVVMIIEAHAFTLEQQHTGTLQEYYTMKKI